MNEITDRDRECCARKKVFKEHVAQAIVRSRKYTLRAYKCNVCQNWHLTKQATQANVKVY